MDIKKKNIYIYYFIISKNTRETFERMVIQKNWKNWHQNFRHLLNLVLILLTNWFVPQISNRGRLGLDQLKELQIEWHSWHQFLKSVGPNSSLLNLLLYWILTFLTFRVALKITVYLGYYKTNQKWNLGLYKIMSTKQRCVYIWLFSVPF